MIEARPFEEYKEMIQDMRKDEMIKGLYDLSKNVIEKENENKKLHSIIKEVREEIEYFDLQANHLDDSIYLDETLTKKLLEILEKENK